MAHDVFISHSAKDKVTGDAVCAMLESNGVRCWIAPRDVVPGEEWGKSIIQAINGSRVMVLVFSSHANDSVQIRKEVERAVNKSVIIVPFRIEDVAPGESLEYFIGNVHWLDALTPPLETHLRNLANTIKVLLGRTAPHDAQDPLPSGIVPPTKAQPPAIKPPNLEIAEPSATIPKTSAPAEENATPPARRLWLRFALGGAGLLIIVLAALHFLGSSSGERSLRNGGRLKLSLLTNDPAKAVGPHLHDYFDPDLSYAVERDLTAPGDVESVKEVTNGMGRPALEIHFSPGAVDRINSGAGIVGRQVALVLDGSTVLQAATVQTPVGSVMEINGNFTSDDIKRLIDGISASSPNKP